MTIPNKPDTPESTEQQLERWLSDGSTWIGVFENQDLGHSDLGRRFAVPYDRKQFDAAQIGKTTGPDTRACGLGWRYILVAKCETAADAQAALLKEVF